MHNAHARIAHDAHAHAEGRGPSDAELFFPGTSAAMGIALLEAKQAKNGFRCSGCLEPRSINRFFRLVVVFLYLTNAK